MVNKFIFRAACMYIFMLPLFLGAQDSPIGNWLIYIGNKKINSQWNIHHEVQYRNYNAIGDLEQLLLRTGVGYNLSENNNNVLLGYGFIRSENYVGGSDDKNVVNEHRIFQQFINKHKVNNLSFQHRFRFEQRFIEGDHRLRLRYFLAMTLPLRKAESEVSKYYLSMYNELFINTTGDAFDRNRLYGGLGYRFTPSFRMELGYMNQFFNQGGRDQINLFAFASF